MRASVCDELFAVLCYISMNLVLRRRVRALIRLVIRVPAVVERRIIFVRVYCV